MRSTSEICHTHLDSVKRISGLMYEESRGILKIFLTFLNTPVLKFQNGEQLKLIYNQWKQMLKEYLRQAI